jgi:tRNA A-37 threonylcarbamoyl transferase component Bud32
VGKVVDDSNEQVLEPIDYLDRLADELSRYQIKSSPIGKDLSIEEIFKEAHNHQVVKQNSRKKIILIHTALGRFYIKLSFLVRAKDRRRHLLLPRRRGAEWRNLHKLNSVGLDAAQPVIWGQNFQQTPNSFFIITRAVEGHTLGSQVEINAVFLGTFFANLHQKGFYYADLHPGNIIIKPAGQPVLIDAQELFFLKKLPRGLRSYNLGKLYLVLASKMSVGWFEEFLRAYNQSFKKSIPVHEIRQASTKHYKKHIKSRIKRCLKNTSEFEAIKTRQQRIYKRKDFAWNREDIIHAIENGVDLKERKVFAYKSFCVKMHAKGWFHKDRCLASWINSRALDMHGIDIPRAWGYFKFNHKSYFIAEYFSDAVPLYKFLPTLTGAKNKRTIIKQLARWVRNIHNHQIWQKDFNSTNVIYSGNRFILLDLDNVRFGRLTDAEKIYNLAQLNASIADTLRLRDRLRFFYYYFDGQWPDRGKRREIYNQIWEITLTKNTAVFGLDNSNASSFSIPE